MVDLPQWAGRRWQLYADSSKVTLCHPFSGTNATCVLGTGTGFSKVEHCTACNDIT